MPQFDQLSLMFKCQLFENILDDQEQLGSAFFNCYPIDLATISRLILGMDHELTHSIAKTTSLDNLFANCEFQQGKFLWQPIKSTCNQFGFYFLSGSFEQTF